MKDMTLSDIEKRTREIKESFSHIDFENSSDKKALKDGLDTIKHEAAALWLQACRCLYQEEHAKVSGKNITWNLLPYDVQVIG